MKFTYLRSTVFLHRYFSSILLKFLIFFFTFLKFTHCSLFHAWTHASKFTCAIYCMCRIIVFSLFVLLLLYISHKEKYICYYFIFLIRRNICKNGLSCIAFSFIARVCITYAIHTFFYISNVFFQLSLSVA